MPKNQSLKISEQKESVMKENEEQSEVEDRTLAQERLESLLERPLKLFGEEAKSDLLGIVWEFPVNHGEVELLRLILEDRLPIIVGRDGNWYTDWYPEEFCEPVFMMLLTAKMNRENEKGLVVEDLSPEDELRIYLAGVVQSWLNRLVPLAMQLSKEGEYSVVLERKIDCLEKLNTGLPFAPRNSRKS